LPTPRRRVRALAHNPPPGSASCGSEKRPRATPAASSATSLRESARASCSSLRRFLGCQRPKNTKRKPVYARADKRTVGGTGEGGKGRPGSASFENIMRSSPDARTRTCKISKCKRPRSSSSSCDHLIPKVLQLDQPTRRLQKQVPSRSGEAENQKSKGAENDSKATRFRKHRPESGKLRDRLVNQNVDSDKFLGTIASEAENWTQRAPTS